MPYALREAISAFRRTPLLSTLSAMMVALSLLLVGLFGVMAHNIRLALQRMESRVEVVAYLRDDAPPQAVAHAQQEIERFEEVREVLYISREQALQRANAELPEFSGIFGSLESNPLPASLEVRLTPGQTGSEAVAAVAERIKGYPFVEQVRFGEDWLDKVFLLRRTAGAASLVLGGAFAGVAMLIIAAAVRLAIYARRDEIAIMRLVGATNGFVRMPFLVEGLIVGMAGAIVALAATYGLFALLEGTVVDIEWMPDAWVLGGIAAGAVLGVLASAVAVRRYLQEV